MIEKQIPVINLLARTHATNNTLHKSYVVVSTNSTPGKVYSIQAEVGVLLTGLIPQHFRACPKPGPRFPTGYVVVFLCSLILGECPLNACVRWLVARGPC